MLYLQYMHHVFMRYCVSVDDHLGPYALINLI